MDKARLGGKYTEIQSCDVTQSYVGLEQTNNQIEMSDEKHLMM